MIAALIAMSINAPATLPLIPLPVSVIEGDGVFRMRESVRIVARRELAFESRFLVTALKKVGVRAQVSTQSSAGERTIELDVHAGPSGSHREGKYEFEVTPSGIRISSMGREGLFYGLQTLRQMLVGRGEAPFDLPAVKIQDEPRFPWRGMHLDVSRQFFTVAEVKKFIDYLSELKMNVFHWHLVDDGGWRMESKKFPKLTSVGAWRKDISDIVWTYSDLIFPGPGSGMKLQGGFYTQDEIRDVVKYAAERHVTIIPEIEMPGHCLPAMEAYPELGCDIEKAPGHGFRTNVFCAGKEATKKFIAEILDETLELFPSTIIHIGGDEVSKDYWRRCPRCNEYMKQKGLRTYEELQSDFIKFAEKHLNSRGRTLLGWDEILEGGLAPNAMVMSWRGNEGGIAAAKSGHEVVMSPTSHCYFDYSYATTPTAKVYGWEPVPSELSATQARYVRGGQANVWTEWLPRFDQIEYMCFPRMLAIAEVLWTPKERMYYPHFLRRLEPHYGEFVKRGIDFYIGAPQFDSNLIVFEKEAELRLEEPPLETIALRYTIDGKDPGPSSPVWPGTLRLDRNATVSAAYLQGGKIVGGITRVQVLKGAPKGSAKPGISFSLVKGHMSKMSDWGKFAEANSGPADSFDISPYKAIEAFGLKWKGFLRIPTSGFYTFTLGSDDGSTMHLAGALIVDNDGPHPYIEKSGKAYLLPGDYPFEIAFFESGGDERFEAFVEGPGLSRRQLEALVVR